MPRQNLCEHLFETENVQCILRHCPLSDVTRILFASVKCNTEEREKVTEKRKICITIRANSCIVGVNIRINEEKKVIKNATYFQRGRPFF